MGRTAVDKHATSVRVTCGEGVTLDGELIVPDKARGVVIFAHGSGSSRHSPRNQFVARVLRDAGLGTLLFDLLTKEEDTVYETRFDINLLSTRLAAATAWFRQQPRVQGLDIGYFGASTGAAAALVASARLGHVVRAVVSRGGRPDLVGRALARVTAPTLLIVGGLDDVVIDLNRRAYEQLRCAKDLVIVPGATHLFEEPGMLEEVARLAAEWFARRLGPRASTT